LIFKNNIKTCAIKIVYAILFDKLIADYNPSLFKDSRYSYND